MDNPFKEDWHDLFYRDPDPDEPRIDEFARWLRKNKDTEISLFHGTGACNVEKVAAKGLLPTTATRRRSLQSGSGFVYLSVFPTSAKMFAQMGYPGRPVVVYAAKVKIKELRTDRDQLKNKRMWDDRKRNVRDCLEHSLVFGYGACVRGKIEPHRLTVIDVPM